MMFYYSKTTNAFYLADSIESYKAAGTWPEDATKIETNIAQEFMQAPQAGKIRVAGENGLPAWGDIPPPTEETLTITAELQRQSLLSRAELEIQWRQDAIDLGIAADEESTVLTEWKKYRIQLMRVDLSSPLWPEIPSD
ncbi:TPA: tail fiber assembly protein [Escherichia coli]|uniref:tail fiber assembly protein n=1 Tax=Escherichia coli TaxID=562 RepID=UPI0020418C52|nr:tail fiber assembly protein [Escherichia coli]